MENLAEAARDMRLLLERGYPRDKVLELAGDRWGLDAQARHILRRAVFAPSRARQRAARLLGPEALAGQEVAVDGHNVIITLESALTGRTLVLGDDGVLRDVSSIGKNHRPGRDTIRAARLMLEALEGLAPKGVRVLLHRRLPHSGRLAGELGGMLTGHGLAGEALTSDSVRRELAAHPGPVASGDAAVLDAGREPFDLAGFTVRGLDPAPAWVSLS